MVGRSVSFHRGCIGFRLANLGIKTVLASLVSNFEFHVKDEGGTPVVGSEE